MLGIGLFLAAAAATAPAERPLWIAQDWLNRQSFFAIHLVDVKGEPPALLCAKGGADDDSLLDRRYLIDTKQQVAWSDTGPASDPAAGRFLRMDAEHAAVWSRCWTDGSRR